MSDDNDGGESKGCALETGTSRGGEDEERTSSAVEDDEAVEEEGFISPGHDACC